jgi:phosphate transport system substrate-binding protein
MKKHHILALICLAVIPIAAASHAQSQPKAGGASVKLTGSTTVFTNVFEKGREAISNEAGVQIEVLANGSRQGLSDLAAGRCDIAMISAPLDEVLDRLPPSEKALLVPSTLTVTSLGETNLVFIVHESNPVQRLTISQLSDLFTGVVTNWKQVGGPDLAVEVVSNQFSSGQRAVLEDQVTKGKAVVSSAKLVVNDPLIPGIVRQLRGGLGHSGARNDLRGVHVLKTDRLIVQPLSLVTRGKRAGVIARVIAAAKKVAALP